jgi:hypothetical protein
VFLGTGARAELLRTGHPPYLKRGGSVQWTAVGRVQWLSTRADKGEWLFVQWLSSGSAQLQVSRELDRDAHRLSGQGWTAEQVAYPDERVANSLPKASTSAVS